MSRQIACKRRQAAREETNHGRLRPTLLAAALGLGVLPTGGALADDSFEIQARELAGASDGSRWRFQGVGVELPLPGGKSWTARGGSVSYKYRPQSMTLVHPPSYYKEDGSGSFLGVGLRFYPGAESIGPYFGVTLDYVSIRVDTEMSDGFSSNQGHGDIVGFVPGISGGYKAVFDNGITFEADLYFGWLFAVDTGDLHRTTSLPGFLGFSLGKRF